MIADRRSCLSSFSASISTRERTVLTSRAEALIGHVLLPRTRPDSFSTKDTSTVPAHPIPVVLAIRVIQGQLADQHEVCLVRTLRQKSRRRPPTLEDSDKLPKISASTL